MMCDGAVEIGWFVLLSYKTYVRLSNREVLPLTFLLSSIVLD